MADRNLVRTNVYLHPQDIEWAKEFADEKGATMAEVIRRAMTFYRTLHQEGKEFGKDMTLHELKLLRERAGDIEQTTERMEFEARRKLEPLAEQMTTMQSSLTQFVEQQQKINEEMAKTIENVALMDAETRERVKRVAEKLIPQLDPEATENMKEISRKMQQSTQQAAALEASIEKMLKPIDMPNILSPRRTGSSEESEEDDN